jgi:hypothetical protein
MRAMLVWFRWIAGIDPDGTPERPWLRSHVERGNDKKHFEFRLKPLNVGTYAVPPVMAEGMYDTSILHRGMAETLKVHE